MSDQLTRPVWKTGSGFRSLVGSNPTLSASLAAGFEAAGTALRATMTALRRVDQWTRTDVTPTDCPEHTVAA